MTTAKRKKIITIETFQRTVIRQNFNQTQILWCDQCSAQVEMAAPEKIAGLKGVTTREIYRRIENDELHFLENHNGLLVICMKSIESEKLINVKNI